MVVQISLSVIPAKVGIHNHNKINKKSSLTKGGGAGKKAVLW